MSGKDEQPLKDFPICLACRMSEKGCYWKGWQGSNLVYFDCIGYEGITKSRAIEGYVGGLKGASLERINLITSIKCGNCSREATGDLFDKIIMLGRKIACQDRMKDL